MPATTATAPSSLIPTSSLAPTPQVRFYKAKQDGDDTVLVHERPLYTGTANPPTYKP